jgi:hypothetical protein
MRAKEIISEIYRIPNSSFEGGDSYLPGYGISPRHDKQKPLPGGSKFTYFVNTSRNETNVYLVDPTVRNNGSKGLIIGKLSLRTTTPLFPLTNTLQVETITLRERYRGQGLAMALYGIVLTVLHKNMLAGDMQTPGGRKQWLKLALIPGCEVVGYAKFPDKMLNKTASLDIVAQLGGDYLGVSGDGDYQYFAFPLAVGKTELLNALSTKSVKTYIPLKPSNTITTGLLARWKP